MRPLISISVLLLVLAAPILAEVDGATRRLIDRGDRYYENWGRGDKWCVKALEAYEKALALEPECVEASWKFARASCWLGSHTADDEFGLEVFRKGIELAKRAIAIDDKSVESHYWLGACYGRYAERNGILKSIALVDPIRDEFKRVVEIDETYEGGGGYRSLGFLEFKLPAVAGGSNERAIELLKKAIRIDAGYLLNHLFLAEVYLGEDQEKLAEKHLRIVIEGEFQEDHRPENEKQKLRAKLLLAELQGE